LRTTILGWSAASGLILGLIAGTLLFGLIVGGTELIGIAPRLAGRMRMMVLVFSFVLLPLAGAVLGWLEGRLKLQ
jgi:hypothetical protein